MSVKFPILFCHRTEGSREIALRLRKLSVLPPLKANRRLIQHGRRNSICKAVIRNVEPKGKKNNLKRKSSASQNEHTEANVEVVYGADGAKTDLQELHLIQTIGKH